MRSIIFILFICCFCLVSIDAQVLRYVGTQQGDYGTIQAAINASSGPLDVVRVRAGTYYENINFSGKLIKVEGIGGASNVTIDGGQNGAVVVFVSGESARAHLKGFTITNGTGHIFDWDDGFGEEEYNCGGGVYCGNSSPKISECDICYNTVQDSADNNDFGGGLFVGSWAEPTDATNLSPRIIDCKIYNNSIDEYGDYGGGVYMVECTEVEFNNNEIYNNETRFSYPAFYFSLCSFDSFDGNYVHDNDYTGPGNSHNAGIVCHIQNQIDEVLITNCIFADNGGDGLIIYNYITQRVVNCTFVNHETWGVVFGMGFAATGQDPVDAYFVNSIAYGNDYYQIHASGHGYNDNVDLYVEYSCVEDGSSGISLTYADLHYSSATCFSTDPDIDSTCHLESTSDCIDEGNNTATGVPSHDIDGDDRDNDSGDPNDIGADEYTG